MKNKHPAFLTQKRIACVCTDGYNKGVKKCLEKC